MSKTKGKNFTDAEDSQLCRSYLHIAKDPAVGTNQSTATFWERLTAHYNENRPAGADERPYRSLETKWATIQHDVGKFCGAIATIKDLAISGASAEDEIQRALELYQKRNTTKAGKPKAFKFLHCWRILSPEPKWQTCRQPTPPANPTGEASENKRPEGVKATKRSAQEAAENERSFKRLAAASVSLARSSQARAEALVDANHMALFSIKLVDLDAEARFFYARQRAKAIRNMIEEEEKGRAENDDNANQPGFTAQLPSTANIE